jgi:peptide/nickel transport system ATP-binding protein/oligopeptide transport system ATP-binding protein
MIAMALSVNAKILIADEPTTALDVTIQAQILELISALQKEYGMSLILITHDMGVISDMADDVLIMYAGEEVEYGSVGAIFRKPMHPYTNGLLRSIPRMDEDAEVLYTIPGTVPTLSEMPEGCHFCTRCPEKMERCETEKPPLTQLEDRSVRCWLFAEGGKTNE